MSGPASEPSLAATTLNDRHAGETVFVIGAGPGLAALTAEQVQRLAQRTCIGVNLTFYVLNPSYFLSAYIGQVLLARHRCTNSQIIHMRPVYEPPLVPGILSLKRDLFSAEVGLPRALSAEAPTLYTKFNVALGATHLAFVMGAKRIVYVGVEQRNQLHFWHHRPELLAMMREDVEILKDVPFLTVDHPYASYEGAVAKIERTAEQSMQPFYVHSHLETFRDYFDILRSAGVTVLTASADSVVRDAGAEFVDIDELLHQDNG